MSDAFSFLYLKDMADGTFLLYKPLVYRPLDISVHKGFRTDFASVPRLFRNIISPYGEHGRAAVLHDFLYSKGGRLDDGREFSRATCDQIFSDAMKACGVNALRRAIMYSAVRAFGWRFFDK